MLNGEGVDISPSVSNFDVKNISGNKHSHLRSRSQFGWQLGLQQTSTTDLRISGTSSAGDPKNNNLTEVLKLLEGGKSHSALKKQLMSSPPPASLLLLESLLSRSTNPTTSRNAAYGPATSPIGANHFSSSSRNNTTATSSTFSDSRFSSPTLQSTTSPAMSLPPPVSSHATSSGGANRIAENTHSHLRSRTEFGWQLALQQTSITDRRELEDREIVTSALVSQVALGKKKEGFLAESQECGVCNELHSGAQTIQLPTCTHTFCRECVCTYTKTRINEGRYPIVCPVCAIESKRVNKSRELVLSYFCRWLILTFS